MPHKWIINSREFFPYSAEDVYLNWWVTTREPIVTQSVVEFFHEPSHYTKLLLKAEKEFRKTATPIPKQTPKDITRYFKSSIQTSKILKEAVSRGERIYGIKVPFHIKKWKTQRGKTVWKKVTFSDGTQATLQVIDKNHLIIMLAIICARATYNDKEIDARFIGSDEIMALDQRHTVFGIKIHEVRAALKSFGLTKNSKSSILIFSAKSGEIKEAADYFIERFNTIIEKGLAGLITEEQRTFEAIEGKTIDEKTKNVVEELSNYSHPYFPESVFGSALKLGLGRTVIEAISIDKGWEKTHYIKKVFDELAFKALFWTSSNWIQLFYEYAETPKIYHKLFSESDYRGQDEQASFEYIENLARRKEVALVDLGIGTGKELKYLKGIKNIKKIVGIDYSEAMLNFSKKMWRSYPKPVKFIRDDFRTLENSKDTIKAIRLPKIFTLFYGTINNTTEEERIKILTSVKKLMTRRDRFLIDFSKLPEEQAIAYKHPWIKFKSKQAELGFYEAEVYAQMQFFWKSAKEYFHTTPQFFYDKKTRNLVVTITGVGSCFFSHRWTAKEIRGLVRGAGLKLEELREGSEMYLAVIRK